MNEPKNTKPETPHGVAVQRIVRPPLVRQQYPDFSFEYEIKEDEERLVISPNIAGNALVELLQAIEIIKTKMATQEEERPNSIYWP